MEPENPRWDPAQPDFRALVQALIDNPNLQPNEATAELQRRWEDQQRQGLERQQNHQGQGEKNHQLDEGHRDPQEDQRQCHPAADVPGNHPRDLPPPPRPQSPPRDPPPADNQSTDPLVFNPNKPVPSTIQMHPSEYAIKRLKTFKNGFLLHIEWAKWLLKVVDSFNWFFFNIETHVFRQQGDWGERVLLHYASWVRADWHDTHAAEHFNIATINKTLLNYIAQELNSRDIGKGIDWLTRSFSSPLPLYPPRPLRICVDTFALSAYALTPSHACIPCAAPPGMTSRKAEPAMGITSDEPHRSPDRENPHPQTHDVAGLALERDRVLRIAN
ncbi:hypothetical protein BKA82DRAFT_25588 [Pisolithus tinctorius]|uniref:Uncharacterized protein n=1 Tax=Pisolithus tinctorius Marx 270 TaxID=870435 RepID=A0A0C3PCL6_PISTI|nr:hypothetical protein BKA82DRAFT_25588 [Pisolithus tinctorius]KIO05469.1 hypothetical protein M404DRAFT_25588 [Pisolithus tinctorius Marx 270]